MYDLNYIKKLPLWNLLLGLLLICCSACSHQHLHTYDDPTKTTRYRIIFEDNIVGHITLVQQTLPDKTRTVETLELRTQFRGMNATANRVTEIHEEDLQGRPLSFSKEIAIPNAERYILGEIQGNKLIVRDKRGDQEQLVHMAVPDNFLLHEGLRQKLHAATKNNQSLAAIALTYMEWSYDEKKFSPVDINLNSGAGVSAWRFIQTSEKKSVKVVREQWVDQEFLPVQARFDYFGKNLLLVRCADQCNHDAIVSLKPLDQQMLDSPYKITESALKGRIRYQIKTAAGRVPPATSEQSVRKTEAAWIVDVCAHCELKQNVAAPDLAHYLTANTWLESTDSRLLSVVAKSVKADDSPAVKMKKLAVVTRKRLEEKPQFSGYATALQAYQSRSGDCTEYALLLAALGRAAQVPTRVVFGLGYSREKFHGKAHAFAPHAWVQAWVEGAWRSYDAAFDSFDAGHIALQISDGNQEDFNAMFEGFNEMKIESMQQVVKPTARP